MNKSTSIAPSGSITSELSGLLKDIAIDDIDKTIADHLTEKYSWVKIFLDTDLILDLLTQREPFYSSTVSLFNLIENKKIIAYTSLVVCANIYYILRKFKGKKEAHQALSRLRLLFKIVPIGEDIIDHALASDFQDFEHAIQYYTATASNIPILITRNTNDFQQYARDVQIATTDEFLNFTALE